MTDLAKYGEVAHLYTAGYAAEGTVSKMLREGWELITVKVVEEQFRVEDSNPAKDYIAKRGTIHYVLGRRRGHKTPEEQKRADETLKILEGRS